MTQRYNAEAALLPLKGFQRATVDYVSKRLLSDADRVRHFLVADEVGLGKTMVARGVIARRIEALQDDKPRINIVYICSNGAIAKQNVARLNVVEKEQAQILPTRLTMLITELAAQNGRPGIKDKGVNFFSLTPGTSLDLKQGGGRKEERAILARLLAKHLEPSETDLFRKMLMRPAGEAGWAWTCHQIDDLGFERSIENRFHTSIREKPELIATIRDLIQQYKTHGDADHAFRRCADRCVMNLRNVLASESAASLEPDLIILDEFQRFTGLLHGNDEAAELARRLFDAEDPDGNQAKVLLLSATPYRMLSLRDDDADAGDHYREFLDVIGFLFGDKGPTVREELEREMHRFRLAMQGLPGSFDNAREIKTGIESQLRKVIARTERVTHTRSRDSMMTDIDVPVSVAPGDLIEARAVAHVAAAADAPGIVEYWKSAPYLLSFLRDYKLGRRLDDAKSKPPKALRKAMRTAKSAQIDKAKVDAYAPIPLNNGRMRALKELAFKDGMARRLWVPPSLPYFGERIIASKLLVFSQWSMVPDAIAALLSYESERDMGMESLGQPYSEAFEKRGALLNFRRNKERLTGLRALPLVLPSPTLAEVADPLEILRKNGSVSNVEAMRALTRQALAPCAHTLWENCFAIQNPYSSDHGEDKSETWDWAGAAQLDVAESSFERWLARGRMLDDVVKESGLDAWHDHVKALSESSTQELRGSPTLEKVNNHLTDLALGSPATCALRALKRVAPDLSIEDPTLLDAAARIGMAFRSLFNQPESQALLKSGSDEFYWHTVLRYCAEHDLQAVLDEQTHILLESEGLTTRPQTEAVTEIAHVIEEALTLKPAQIDVKTHEVKSRQIHQSSFRMRGRFATRLLQKASEDGGVQRTDIVRTAFNSPFRPFVLATTSVGQEGLDFHPWCHRLVHWNLPSNPVDLEQREGRVHRYKNHAVRLNLAGQFRDLLQAPPQIEDPWNIMFQAAHAQREESGDLEPFWLLDGDTSIERYALLLPYSREKSLFSWLKRSVALYRLAFGQPRQDDLLSYLDSLDLAGDVQDLRELQISLQPQPNHQSELDPTGC